MSCVPCVGGRREREKKDFVGKKWNFDSNEERDVRIRALQVLIFMNWRQNWEDFAELFWGLKLGLSVDRVLFWG